MITGIVYVCDECGSDNVDTQAWAKWDVEEQRWVLSDLMDRNESDFCNDCADYQCLIDRRVNLKDIAKVVIKKEEAHEATTAA